MPPKTDAKVRFYLRLSLCAVPSAKFALTHRWTKSVLSLRNVCLALTVSI